MTTVTKGLVKIKLDERLWLQEGKLRHALSCPCYKCAQTGRTLEMKRAHYVKRHPEDKNLKKVTSGKLASHNRRLKEAAKAALAEQAPPTNTVNPLEVTVP